MPFFYQLQTLFWTRLAWFRLASCHSLPRSGPSPRAGLPVTSLLQSEGLGNCFSSKHLLCLGSSTWASLLWSGSSFHQDCPNYSEFITPHHTQNNRLLESAQPLFQGKGREFQHETNLGSGIQQNHSHLVYTVRYPLLVLGFSNCRM